MLCLNNFSGTEKGVMVPPVIVDVDGDSVSDILVSLFEGRMVLKNGRDLSVMWTASFPGAESYSTPAPGYFDDDDVVDFMVHWSTGNWPWYSHSNVRTRVLNEPRHMKTCLRGFGPGKTQTGLLSFGD